MPALEAVIAKGNVLLNRENVLKFENVEMDISNPIPDEIFEEFGIATPEEIAYLRRWPEGVKAVFRAAMYSAVKRRPDPIPVTLAWMPSYDYEITVSEARGTTGTTMTILLRGPYEKVPETAD